MTYQCTISLFLHTQNTLKQLCGAFFLCLSKCILAKQQLSYLGRIVSPPGVALDPDKIQAMVDQPIPASPSKLRSFMSLIGFYRKFIRSYAAIAAPLTTLLCKDKFSWSPTAQEAFQQLKTIMTQAPALTTPDFTIQFTIETDASGTAIGAVLLQNSHPIAKQLCPRL